MKNPYKRWLILLIVTTVYAIFSYWTADILIDDNSFRPAIAILAAFSAIEGPLFGFLMGFMGNIGVDLLAGDFWLSWSLGNGIIGALVGLLLLVPGFLPKKGEVHVAHYVMFIIFSAIGNYVGLIVAALIDVILSQYDFELAVFQWAFSTATVNSLLIAMLGVPLLYAYTRRKRINS